MIEPRKTPRKYRPISTYDFEWHRGERGYVKRGGKWVGSRKPWLRLCGFYDERGYHSFTTIQDFADYLLLPINSGRRIYAHAGGLSDMVFLLRELMTRKHLRLTGIFSGSSLIFLRIEWEGMGEWELLDSYWTMRAPLADIGDWLGGGSDAKGKVDYDNCPIGELRTYNEQDCRILHKALSAFQDSIWDQGGELRITAASTALDVILRRFLKRRIRNTPAFDDYVREGYVASRVEPIRRECMSARYFDINSSFPFSWKSPLPGNGRWNGKSIPTADNALWFADCDVRVRRDEYLPPIPFRHEGRVFFPTGRFRAVISSEDMLAGGFDIETVHSCATFEPFDDFGEFAETFFALRQRSGLEGKCFKIVLNGGYGKFAERSDKEVLLVNPRERDITTQTMVSPGIYIASEVRDIAHSHVPISAMTTARSRRYLLEHMRYAHDLGNVYYCDTDALICDAELPTGAALGALKDEGTIRDGIMHGPKLYAGYMRPPGEDEKLITKAKGFSRVVGEDGQSSKLTYEDFIAVIEGREQVVERMLRVRELIRMAQGCGYEPITIESGKRLKQGTRPKRMALKNGDSRPWSAREICAGWNQDDGYQLA